MTKRNGKNMLMRYILRGDKEIYVGHYVPTSSLLKIFIIERNLLFFLFDENL